MMVFRDCCVLVVSFSSDPAADLWITPAELRYIRGSSADTPNKREAGAGGGLSIQAEAEAPDGGAGDEGDEAAPLIPKKRSRILFAQLC